MSTLMTMEIYEKIVIFEPCSEYIKPDDEKNMITFLMESLSYSRADVYGSWIKVNGVFVRRAWAFQSTFNFFVNYNNLIIIDDTGGLKRIWVAFRYMGQYSTPEEWHRH